MLPSKSFVWKGRASMRRLFRAIGKANGDALVEMAIVLPLLTLILLGAFDMGMAAYTSIEVSNAALAGVQYGAQNATAAGDVTGIQNAAAADASNITLGPTSASHTCICADGSASTCQPTDCSGSAIVTILTVQTQATFTPFFHLPSIPTSFTIQGQAIQKVMQ